MSFQTRNLDSPRYASGPRNLVWQFIFAATLLASVSGALAQSSEQSSEHSSNTPSLPSVTVATVGEAEVIGRVPMSGTLVPRSEVLVYPLVSGYTIGKNVFRHRRYGRNG